VEKDGGAGNADRFRAHALDAAAEASDWEREHIQILFGLVERGGETREASRRYIDRNPGDLLVVSQLAGWLIFHGGVGKLEAVRRLLESVGPALADDWAWLARMGFAASEAGDHQRGRELIERALRLRPQSLYTIHALAHLLHDEGAADESTRVLNDWLAEHGDGARNGQMYGHVQWHLALAEWQTGERAAACKRYEAHCAPGTTTCGPILTLADCGGFLLRDYLATGQARALPGDVLAHIDRVWPMLAHPFVALHVAALFASADDVAGLERCREAILESPPGPNRDVSLALVSALLDFVSGERDHAARTLASLSPEARVGIGGSNVERILVELIEQAVRGVMPGSRVQPPTMQT